MYLVKFSGQEQHKEGLEPSLVMPIKKGLDLQVRKQL